MSKDKIATQHVISSVRQRPHAPKSSSHVSLTVFNRGANAGTLVVNKRDVDEIVRRLLGEG